MYLLPSAEDAARFTKMFPAVIAGKTGRHTYTEWDQVLMGMGAAHPAMNPYNHPGQCRLPQTYNKDMCARSLDILNRTVMVPTDPEPLGGRDRRDHPQHRGRGPRRASAAMSEAEAELKPTSALDAQKFDMKAEG